MHFMGYEHVKCVTYIVKWSYNKRDLRVMTPLYAAGVYRISMHALPLKSKALLLCDQEFSAILFE